MKQQPNADMIAMANHQSQCAVIKTWLYLRGQPAHTSRYELMISYVWNHLTEDSTIRNMAKKIETGWFNLMKLDPILLNTSNGIGWGLEVRGWVTLKEMTALVVESFLAVVSDGNWQWGGNFVGTRIDQHMIRGVVLITEARQIAGVQPRDRFNAGVRARRQDWPRPIPPGVWENAISLTFYCLVKVAHNQAATPTWNRNFCCRKEETWRFRYS